MPLDGKGTDVRSIWMKLSLALALLGVVPLALAAGFDCARASNTAERKICADPRLSASDSQMDQAFEQARAKAGPQADALVRDQRNWLRERNERMAQGKSDKAVYEIGEAIYQDRIEYLQHVLDAPPTDTPLLAAIVKYLANPSSAALLQRDEDMNRVLGGDGSVFKVATEQMFDPSKPQPFDVESLVKMAGQMTDPDGLNAVSMRLSLLDDLHFGALYFWEGTANCIDVMFFSWHGRTIKPVAAPGMFNQDCGMSGGPLIEFQGHAYAMQLGGRSVASTDIIVQRWEGGGWGSFNRMHVRWDYSTLPKYMHCALADCAELTAQVSKVLVRYLQDFDADALAGQVPADVRMQFEVERKLAVKGDVYELPWGNTPKRFYVGMDGFDNTSMFFPIHWQGEWLLGRVGHASMGWRTSDADWLLGVWRWDGHTFTPVLGMVAEAQRTKALLATWANPYAN
ncbi:lysozyme inhibitor LprI family protein [Rhodanobacter sp. DHB23]|uniref:lysozyme inhibitor LprI family protein n=1 Tax=Rhodanobacter sp. DHB23 TaxID=2775923 RepID=UPI00177A8E9D|nr:lysozyme inhibitor LprI family protein [Rhodanobacter sp. DHB23]MBD8873479.1 DUF1311 domain-containing protein [Rhodanobacter sp. DHB23]